ncbi:hypothetical protein CQS04_05490 [Chryseomicrobium excrementi]|uniref:Uncharacterized protein n=1 Tax=Chryseomicrobium excrementi TaxID=2041346 RepID=A0A2M9EZI2_9BACL|nr:hypothetical protein CQS04_05490 [Chryseomicrobium excrementi]
MFGRGCGGEGERAFMGMRGGIVVQGEDFVLQGGPFVRHKSLLFCMGPVFFCIERRFFCKEHDFIFINKPKVLTSKTFTNQKKDPLKQANP